MERSSLPVTAPLAYSAIFFMTSSAASFHWILIALTGQTVMQREQPVHFFGMIAALPLAITIASWAQAFRQFPQPVQSFLETFGATLECCTSLPLRLAQPIPRFLMAPPKPVRS